MSKYRKVLDSKARSFAKRYNLYWKGSPSIILGLDDLETFLSSERVRGGAHRERAIEFQKRWTKIILKTMGL